jgi:hypothetical protein
MLCKFCQENVRGTPCQSASQASKCPNNRDNDWPDDDRIADDKPVDDSDE